jgi:hypothetical protein
MRFNGDSATRYANKLGGPSSSEAFGDAAVTSAYGNDNAVDDGILRFTILGYANTTSWKFVNVQGIIVNNTTPANASMILVYSGYNQTPAITSLTLLPNSGNFTSGSYTLWGVK